MTCWSIYLYDGVLKALKRGCAGLKILVKRRQGRHKNGPCCNIRQRPFLCKNYFLQAQPQPEDFLSSFFCMVPASAHSGHFFGLHLPSLVAPHFSHLNTAIFFSFWLIQLKVKIKKYSIYYYQNAYTFCFLIHGKEY